MEDSSNVLEPPRVWALITKKKRDYAGNAGYRDDLRRIYRYDTRVPNHKRMRPRDIVLLRDGKQILGAAIIKSIASKKGQKIIRRCPICNRGIRERKHGRRRFRCKAGHTFATPRSARVPVRKFEAHFGRSFVGFPKGIPAKELKAAALRPARQNAMEEVDPVRISKRLAGLSPPAFQIFNLLRRDAYDLRLRRTRSRRAASGNGLDNVRRRDPLRRELIKEVRSAKKVQKVPGEYEYKPEAEIRTIQMKENALVARYRDRLALADRICTSLTFGGLTCDGFERARQNLIEAKSSISREHIRMAVGQLFDYGHCLQNEFKDIHRAILLPKRPDQTILAWLISIKIWVIWEGKTGFADNAKGRFI